MEIARKGMLSHDVYFQLRERSDEARRNLVDSCKKYLKDHEGIVSFACGVLSDELRRDVNDRDFDVGLHIVFRDMAAHDRYQAHEQHRKFIDENQAGWANVRVFDTAIE